MPSGIANGTRSTMNMHEASTAIMCLRRDVPEVELCTKLCCTATTLKAWVARGVPASRCAAVVGLWLDWQAAKPLCRVA